MLVQVESDLCFWMKSGGICTCCRCSCCLCGLVGLMCYREGMLILEVKVEVEVVLQLQGVREAMNRSCSSGVAVNT
jgi:hypothetical protein